MTFKLRIREHPKAKPPARCGAGGFKTLVCALASVVEAVQIGNYIGPIR